MDDKTIFFSIVVPVYNVEQFLDDCVRSILEQTYKEFELILVDDASTDSSGQMCDLYEKEDCRIRVIHKKTVVWSVREKLSLRLFDMLILLFQKKTGNKREVICMSIILIHLLWVMTGRGNLIF